MAYKLCDAPLRDKDRGCSNPVRGNWRCSVHGGPSKALVDEYFEALQRIDIESADSGDSLASQLGLNPAVLTEVDSKINQQNDSILSQDTAIVKKNKALKHSLDTVKYEKRTLRKNRVIVKHKKRMLRLKFGTFEYENIRFKRELKTDRAGLSKAADDSKSAKDNARSHKRDRDTSKNSTDRVSWSWKKKSKKISRSAINMLMAAVSKPENVDLLKGLIGVAEIVFKFFSV